MPKHLRDTSYPGAARLGHGRGYVYPHDDPAGLVRQQYAPDGLADTTYYRPSAHGQEARYAERSARIRRVLGRDADPDPAETDGDAADDAADS